MKDAAIACRAALRGLSGERIALILAVGLVLGTFPVYGCPTVMCIVAALCLRVNLPALQLVNQLTSPLQLMLLVPLASAGSHIFGGTPQGASPLLARLGSAMAHAIGGWFCICVPLGVALYLGLAGVLRHREGRRAQ